jgi:hypothetical protein
MFKGLPSSHLTSSLRKVFVRIVCLKLHAVCFPIANMLQEHVLRNSMEENVDLVLYEYAINNAYDPKTLHSPSVRRRADK